MPSTMNGQPTKPIPANMAGAIKRGVPQRTAQAMIKRSGPTVKVK